MDHFIVNRVINVGYLCFGESEEIEDNFFYSFNFAGRRGLDRGVSIIIVVFIVESRGSRTVFGRSSLHVHAQIKKIV